MDENEAWLSGLEAAPARPRGTQCVVSLMRKARPDLSEKFDFAIDRRREGVSSVSDEALAAYFTGQGYPMDRNAILRHRNKSDAKPCLWCAWVKATAA